MKRFLLLIALCLPMIAQAVQIEAEIGGAHFSDSGNMTWYQEGLPHNLRLQSPVVSLGIGGDLYASGRYGVAWHAAYAYMGPVRTDAVATPDDANYDRNTKSCRGECIAHSNFVGRGATHGLRLTLEPYVVHRGWRVGIEGGVFIARNSWDMTVYDWIPATGHTPKTIKVSDTSGWQAHPVVGLSVGRGNLDVVYRMYWNQSPKSTLYPAIWSRTQTLTLRYRF